ncbi:MAG: sulfate ABC transporter ATP-binding protein [Ferrovibrio sp.]
MRIDVNNLTRVFGDFYALRNVDLGIRSGELVALLGPSGSGKTTLLRIIAGLDWPDDGDIKFNGDSTRGRSVGERQVGFVFQHYALFRHMTVFENVAFGLRVRPRQQRLPEPVIRERVNRLLQLVQIDWLADRMPAQLSGGQRQRVALARALAIEPNVLLLDEPFGALDAKVRKELRRWLRRLHEQLGMTSVFVTHDQEEALELADRVVVMNKGRIEQIDTPARLYDHPATPFVSGFLGDNNALDCHVAAGSVLLPGLDTTALDRVALPNGPARLYARPHDIAVAASPGGEATIRFVSTVGAFVRVEAELPDGRIVELTRTREEQGEDPLAVGARVGLRLYRAQVFAAS